MLFPIIFVLCSLDFGEAEHRRFKRLGYNRPDFGMMNTNSPSYVQQETLSPIMEDNYSNMPPHFSNSWGRARDWSQQSVLHVNNNRYNSMIRNPWRNYAQYNSWPTMDNERITSYSTITTNYGGSAYSRPANNNFKPGYTYMNTNQQSGYRPYSAQLMPSSDSLNSDYSVSGNRDYASSYGSPKGDSSPPSDYSPPINSEHGSNYGPPTVKLTPSSDTPRSDYSIPIINQDSDYVPPKKEPIILPDSHRSDYSAPISTYHGSDYGAPVAQNHDLPYVSSKGDSSAFLDSSKPELSSSMTNNQGPAYISPEQIPMPPSDSQKSDYSPASLPFPNSPTSDYSSPINTDQDPGYTQSKLTPNLDKQTPEYTSIIPNDGTVINPNNDAGIPNSGIPNPTYPTPPETFPQIPEHVSSPHGFPGLPPDESVTIEKTQIAPIPPSIAFDLPPQAKVDDIPEPPMGR